MDKPNTPPEPKPSPSQPGRGDPPAKRKDPAAPASPSGAKKGKESLRTGIRWGLVVSLAAALLIGIFAVQNTESTDVKFLFWTWNMPLVVLILLVVLLSVVADEFITFWLRRRKRQRLNQQLKQAGLRR